MAAGNARGGCGACGQLVLGNRGLSPAREPDPGLNIHVKPGVQHLTSLVKPGHGLADPLSHVNVQRLTQQAHGHVSLHSRLRAASAACYTPPRQETLTLLLGHPDQSLVIC